MLYRIEAGLFPHLDDTIGRKTAASIREALGIPVKSVHDQSVHAGGARRATGEYAHGEKRAARSGVAGRIPVSPAPARRRHIVDH